MINLTPEQLASGNWVWDDSKQDFVNINAKPVEPEPEEPEAPIPTQATVGMKWNGCALV